jgi:tRNA G18 (ribose-2'-O)-methylase SpoU
MDRKQQHKKCSELLKEWCCHPSETALKQEYTKLCAWMDLPDISNDRDAIEERFHEHVRLSGRSLMEYDFLNCADAGDRTTGQPWGGVHTYLDGLRSCHNVGSILRTVEAFRLGPVHFSGDMMPHSHRQVQKTSMGAWQWVEMTQGMDVNALPRPWIALETVPHAPSWNEWIYPKQCTIMVGNEERGIRRSTLSLCDGAITIPLVGRKHSLNVANAFAIVASEIAAQRTYDETV